MYVKNKCMSLCEVLVFIVKKKKKKIKAKEDFLCSNQA